MLLVFNGYMFMVFEVMNVTKKSKIFTVMAFIMYAIVLRLRTKFAEYKFRIETDDYSKLP